LRAAVTAVGEVHYIINKKVFLIMNRKSARYWRGCLDNLTTIMALTNSCHCEIIDQEIALKRIEMADERQMEW